MQGMPTMPATWLMKECTEMPPTRWSPVFFKALPTDPAAVCGLTLSTCRVLYSGAVVA